VTQAVDGGVTTHAPKVQALPGVLQQYLFLPHDVSFFAKSQTAAKLLKPYNPYFFDWEQSVAAKSELITGVSLKA
jgi:hypothetical protein